MTISSTPIESILPNTFEERLQARLEALELEAGPPPRRRSDTQVIDLDAPSGHEATTEELNRQVKVLRHQLKGALEEVDRRLAESAEHAHQAEVIAAGAEAHAVNAEARAVSAETRAVEAAEALQRLEASLGSGSSPDTTESRLRLREALNQLRTRTRGSA